MNHPFDGNMIAADAHYDRLEVGTEPGDDCLRADPPDEDAPKGWKPKPCRGAMIEEDGVTVCPICGEEV